MGEAEALDALKQALDGSDAEKKLELVIGWRDEHRTAKSTLETALDAADSRLKVALLDALYRTTRDEAVKAELEKLLDSEEAKADAGEELYMMARIALNRVDRDAEDVISAEGFETRELGEDRDEPIKKLAVVIHGTWASDVKWWRPGGNFHNYLRTDLGLDHLYAGDKPFKWSGRNRGSARKKAAKALAQWIATRNADMVEVYAHSHGANVAMLSTRLGQTIDRLVMLSPPVRRDYYADWARVKKAYNIQASFDAVVGIARGGQWFKLPHVKEKELEDRGHSVSHEPDVWERNKVPEFVDLR